MATVEELEAQVASLQADVATLATRETEVEADLHSRLHDAKQVVLVAGLYVNGEATLAELEDAVRAYGVV